MPVSTAQRLSPVHGGLSTPVLRIESRDHFNFVVLKTAPSIEVNETDRTTLYRIGDGTLSPLNGPMSSADYRSVLDECSITLAGRKWTWAIPIVLPVTDAEAAALVRGKDASLRSNGEIFGRIRVNEVFDWNKAEFVEKVYGTQRTDHPGARLWLGDPRTKCVGGIIYLLPFNDPRPFAKRVLTPALTRHLIERKGWEQAIAFQTRNPLHRAHEYALVYGAEKILRETGRKTGVVLNPLVGQLKEDDVPADVRMLTYEALIANKELGQGDIDAELWKSKGQDFFAQCDLVGLDMRMYYGGPREAVQHAIYRQNHGFTHFIIGRKHADAPYDDKSPIWGDFDAQEIFAKIGSNLAIKTVNVGFAAYFEEIGRVGIVDENKGRTQVSISGTKVREQLCAGQLPDPRIMRPATANVLMQHYAKQK
jgi:sulfate adenylyltransferase